MKSVASEIPANDRNPARVTWSGFLARPKSLPAPGSHRNPGLQIALLHGALVAGLQRFPQLGSVLLQQLFLGCPCLGKPRECLLGGRDGR